MSVPCTLVTYKGKSRILSKYLQKVGLRKLTINQSINSLKNCSNNKNFWSIKVRLNFGHLNITNRTFEEYHCRWQLCVLIRSISILKNSTVKYVSVKFFIWASVVCNQSFSCFHSNLCSAVTVWECHWWYIQWRTPQFDRNSWVSWRV